MRLNPALDPAAVPDPSGNRSNGAGPKLLLWVNAILTASKPIDLRKARSRARIRPGEVDAVGINRRDSEVCGCGWRKRAGASCASCGGCAVAELVPPAPPAAAVLLAELVPPAPPAELVPPAPPAELVPPAPPAPPAELVPPAPPALLLPVDVDALEPLSAGMSELSTAAMSSQPAVVQTSARRAHAAFSDWFIAVCFLEVSASRSLLPPSVERHLSTVSRKVPSVNRQRLPAWTERAVRSLDYGDSPKLGPRSRRSPRSGSFLIRGQGSPKSGAHREDAGPSRRFRCSAPAARARSHRKGRGAPVDAASEPRGARLIVTALEAGRLCSIGRLGRAFQPRRASPALGAMRARQRASAHRTTPQ